MGATRRPPGEDGFREVAEGPAGAQAGVRSGLRDGRGTRRVARDEAAAGRRALRDGAEGAGRVALARDDAPGPGRDAGVAGQRAGRRRCHRHGHGRRRRGVARRDATGGHAVAMRARGAFPQEGDERGQEHAKERVGGEHRVQRAQQRSTGQRGAGGRLAGRARCGQGVVHGGAYSRGWMSLSRKKAFPQAA